jgi:polyisoprenoid-binding protein YceI
MKKTFLAIAFIAASAIVFAQKKTTTSAIISFDATTALDNLPKAENKTAVAALDTKTGVVQFEATVKSFSFSNPRMQEHFNNETWMNSDQFPTATFDGKITNLSAVNFSKDGTYNATVEGELTIRGVAQKVSTPATIVVSGGKIEAKTDFSINLDDYKISAGPITQGKVSKEPKISVVAVF